MAGAAREEGFGTSACLVQGQRKRNMAVSRMHRKRMIAAPAAAGRDRHNETGGIGDFGTPMLPR